MPNPTLIPPFVVADKARKKPFTLDMEISSILCLAEAQRKKPGILGVSSEKISFISKLHYPVWVVPWKDSCLLIDGLEIFSYVIPYTKLPDVCLFMEDIKRSVVNKEHFRNTLKKHGQTFKNSELTQISLEAIFNEEELLSVFDGYLEQVLSLKKERSERVALLPPKLNEKAALKRAEKAVNLWEQIQSEIKGLHYAINILNEETSFEEEMILREIEHIRELYENKIAPVRPIVEKRIERLLSKRDAELAKLDKALERKLSAKLRQKRRYEYELERLERNLIECRKRREMWKRRGDEISASKWEHRMKIYQNKLSEVKRKLKFVSELIEQIRKQGEFEAERVKANYQVLVENERRKILDLEASRDLEIESRRSQINEIKAEASAIIEQIQRLIELKRLEAYKIKEATIPHKVEKIALLCLPFYLVRYEAKRKTRYHIYPPMIAMDFKGIVKKLQKAVYKFSLQSRIELLLRSKSKALEKMLRKVLLEKIQADITLKKAIYELGISNNIFHDSGFKESLTRGVEELRSEGWISREEKEAILRAYL